MKQRQFKHPNTTGGWICPICKTSSDYPIVLVGIPGTEDDNIMEAEQIHTECYRVFAKMNDFEINIEELEEKWVVKK